MIRRCDCGTKHEAKIWCHVHGYLNKEKLSPKKPSPEPPPKKASK